MNGNIMSKGISVGDLVMVVKPCRCGRPGRIGFTFTVSYVDEYDIWCDGCNESTIETAAVGEGAGFGVYRLTKIDPPALPKEIETKEELTA